ncbi:hypothetical protein RchiOBHm_Chr3g0453241 [Rosa chinensis]|uniref:Uncharacterized protein n=1 Tax=Rosa chinensis TaxID=74649 RepID=A0A2P6R6I3_ROSCH|nr:hypothetical protein RchiOBHm_Chr3g0453241 [Rosa chinensis]
MKSTRAGMIQFGSMNGKPCCKVSTMNLAIQALMKSRSIQWSIGKM